MHLPSLYVLVLVMLMTVPLLTKRFDIFAPVTLATGMYLGFVLGAIYSISNNMTFVQDRIGSSLIGLKISGSAGAWLLSRTLLYLILGLVLYYLGYYWATKRINARYELSRPPKAQRDLRPEIYWFIIAYAVAGALTFYFFYVRPLGGLDIVFGYLNTSLLAQWEADRGASWLGGWLIIAANLLWFPYALESWKGRSLFCLHFAVTAIVVFSSGRIGSMMITFLLSTIIRYRYSASGRKTKRGTYAMVLIAVLVLGVAVSGFRYAIETRQTGQAGEFIAKRFSVQGFTEEIIEKRNITDISILAQIIDGVPDEIPFQYGGTFLFMFNLIQASVSNQSTSGAIAAATLLRDIWYEGQSGSTPPTILGEFYLNFGLPGIIGGMFLFGVLSGHLYRWMITRQDHWIQLVYSFVVIQMVMFLIKGEFVGSITPVFLWLVPAIGTVLAILLLRSLSVSLMRSKASCGAILDSELSR